VNLLDIAIIALCLGFAVYGIFQGMVRQLFSWGGLILGHIAGVRYYETVQEYLRLDFPHAEIVAYLLVFLGVYVIVRLAGLIVERVVRRSELSGADRAAGMVAGFAKGALLSVLLVFVLVILLPKDTAFLRESTLAPRAMVAVTWVAKIFPEKIRDAFREKTGDHPPPSGKEDALPAAPQPKNPPGK